MSFNISIKINRIKRNYISNRKSHIKFTNKSDKEFKKCHKNIDKSKWKEDN